MTNASGIDDPRIDKLDELTSAPRIVSGSDGHDVSTSMRPGEDPAAIAREIDGLEHAKTETVPIGRLAMFDLVDE